MQSIKGCITALITPFNNDGLIDIPTFQNLIERQIRNNAHGLVPCGTTGESPTLNHQEHQEVIKIAIDTVDNRIPIIAGTGSNSTEEALKMTEYAESVGADASLQVVPYYNKPNQEGLYEHFTKISMNTSLPIILYNIPGRSVVNLEPSTIKMLVDNNKNIIGIKEASGDMNKVKEIKKVCPDDFIILSGEDQLNLQVLKEGGSGFISVTSNLLPAECSKLFETFEEGDIEKSEQINESIFKVNKFLFIDTNPIPIKYALSTIGLCENNLRLPLTKLNKNKSEILAKEIKKLNISK